MAIWDALDDGSQVARLLRIFAPLIIELAFGDAQDDGVDVAWDLGMTEVQALLDDLATDVQRVTEATRDEIRALVGQQADEGWSVAELAAAIRDRGGIASQTRARTIARTETGTAYNRGAIVAYRAGGVTHVTVLDGDEDEPCASANGARWTLDEAAANPLGHPNCLVGSTQVVAPHLIAGYAREFHGEVVILRTAMNDTLTCTPNHPVLTDRGWVAAGLLSKGDKVVRCLDGQRVAHRIDPDNDRMPASIEQCVETLRKAPRSASCLVPGTPIDFHGDGTDRQVDVVLADSLLWDGDSTKGGKQSNEGSFVGANQPISPRLSGVRSLHQVSIGAAHAAHSSVSSGTVARTLLGRPLARLTYLGLAGVSQGVSAPTKRTPQAPAVNVEIVRQLLRGLAGEIALVELSEVERKRFAGHVFNLSTAQEWYIAENIITHNCTRAFSPVVE